MDLVNCWINILLRNLRLDHIFGKTSLSLDRKNCTLKQIMCFNTFFTSNIISPTFSVAL